MGEAAQIGLDELPQPLLQTILAVGGLGAADLARVEASSYTFREAVGVGPYRFKSMVENVAFQHCQSDPLFLRLPPAHQTGLLRRFKGNWKLVWRFLQATRLATDGVPSSGGTVKVAAGKYLTFLTTGSGLLLGCGSNKFGILAQGSEVTQCRVPVQVPVPKGTRVLQVSGIQNHVAFVTDKGLLYTYGDDSSGCCGHGNASDAIGKPKLVESLSEVFCKQVSTGLSFTVALTREGHVYSWGSGSRWQLGHGDAAEQWRPTKIESLSSVGEVVQVAAGTSYTLCVLKDGRVYFFGAGSNPCLGHAERVQDGVPHPVAFDREVFITSVSAGDEHCVAIDSQGQVYTWGKGYCGALGHGSEVDVWRPQIVRALESVSAVQVFAGRRKTFVLSDAGDVFAFGWDAFGSLGVKNRSEKVLTPEVLTEYRHIAQLSSGMYHTSLLGIDGSVSSFGDNQYGQLNFIAQPDGARLLAGSEMDEVADRTEPPDLDAR